MIIGRNRSFSFYDQNTGEEHRDEVGNGDRICVDGGNDKAISSESSQYSAGMLADLLMRYLDHMAGPDHVNDETYAAILEYIEDNKEVQVYLSEAISRITVSDDSIERVVRDYPNGGPGIFCIGCKSEKKRENSGAGKGRPARQKYIECKKKQKKKQSKDRAKKNSGIKENY